MNCPIGNTFLSQPSPSLCKTRADVPQLLLQKLSASLDRHIDPGRAKDCITLFAGKSLPGNALNSIVAGLGPFPSPHLQQDAWTTKALTDFLWKDGVPAFSLLWLGEPDLTQHESAPGAQPAMAAIKSSDGNLGVVLSTLDRQG